jgi:hypothetical protein
MEVRQVALESELNDAIVVLSGTEFLFADFDLEALFLDCLVNTTARMSCFGFKIN